MSELTKKAPDLAQTRRQIDEIDAQMAALFEARMQLVGDVAAYKKENGLAVFDAVRERAVIEKNAARFKNKTLLAEYRKFQQNVMDQSKEVQKRILGID